MRTVRRLDIPCGQTYLFALDDGALLEGGDVFMARERRYGERPYRFADFDRPSDFAKRVFTVCTMAGCPVGCRFCASSRSFKRLLTGDEIAGQVLKMAEEGAQLGREPDLNRTEELRVLYTRMGEPMLNVDHVADSIAQLAARFPHVIIGMSTSGIKKGLDRFLSAYGDLIPYLDMQFSLHSTEDEERAWLFRSDPGVTMLSIPEIAEYVERWSEHTTKRTSLNVILFEDFTYDFKSLLQWFDRDKIWLRLSPWNRVEGREEHGLDGLLRTTDVSEKSPISSAKLARIIAEIEEAGFTYAYAPAIDEEIKYAVACGQALEAFQRDLVAERRGQRTHLRLRSDGRPALELVR
ncbi:MAG: radical SAM protein [Deltaproteobacteria bacterium]|nr:radical SAM protein [Deltaproteobacteria bacterium]